MKGKLYLIPNSLGPEPVNGFQHMNAEIINQLNHLIVENGKEARKFLKKLNLDKALQDFTYYELNKHDPKEDYANFLTPLKQGFNMGVISDAGCPGVADPGATIVKLAHQSGIEVVPLTGPSSILLALMASGFNGQQFAFHGYLPKDRPDRIKKIKDMERLSGKLNQTQIFIETPYRNHHMAEDIIDTCQRETMLCIAANLTQSDEKIVSKSIGEWKKIKYNFHKIPAVFLLYSGNI